MIAVQIQCVLQILPLSCEFVIKEKSSNVFNFGDQPASWILSTGENPLIYVQTFVHTFWCISYENVSQYYLEPPYSLEAWCVMYLICTETHIKLLTMPL